MYCLKWALDMFCDICFCYFQRYDTSTSHSNSVVFESSSKDPSSGGVVFAIGENDHDVIPAVGKKLQTGKKEEH